MDQRLKGRRIAALAADGFEKVELVVPMNALQAAGARVDVISLRRGTLSASGTVVWRQEGKAGLRFDRPIDVTGWLPAGSTGQQAVDRAFQELKAAAAAPSYPTQVPQLQQSPVDTDELLRTAAALDDLADALAEDPAVVASHGSKLQTFDIAAQLLRRYAASL